MSSVWRAWPCGIPSLRLFTGKHLWSVRIEDLDDIHASQRRLFTHEWTTGLSLRRSRAVPGCAYPMAPLCLLDLTTRAVGRGPWGQRVGGGALGPAGPAS
ncbi:hypothetical protein GCM10009663_39340 [Kitasatospora arboriphila]|uniref:Uncharacterized protein n=1 Tax=Kitasatospora arboriphila TaxID=258052 RepID=A0ABN1TMX7_9ACTN